MMSTGEEFELIAIMHDTKGPTVLAGAAVSFRLTICWISMARAESLHAGLDLGVVENQRQDHVRAELLGGYRL